MRRYYIFQLPHNNPNIFRHFKEDKDIDLGDYVPVWTDECGYQNDLEICEKLFQKFNIDHPKNFAGHSMSVSDIVMFRDGNVNTFYYCDSIGFKKINKINE
jgi:hypothetical protein